MNAVISCGGHNWDCTVDANGKIVPGPMMTQFIANYGFAVSPSTYNNQPVVMYNGKIAGTKGYFQTQFGLRGYYNPANGGNSVSQFCRQCHGSHANEYNNAPNIPTS